MKFSPIIAVIVLVGSFTGSPVFAASANTLKTQQQKFEGVLDTYLSANQKLETRITNVDTLDEQTRNFLLSLVRSEKSDLYTIRATLFSTTTTKDIQALAKRAQQKRTDMKNNETRVIAPLLQVSDFKISVLPTAEARLKTLDSTLTKKQYDRAAAEIGALKSAAHTLHNQLLSTTPPKDAAKRVLDLHGRTKHLYNELRSTIR